MSTVSQDRLQFVAEQRSVSFIARETGLSRYMVNRVLTEQRDIPTESRSQVRNLYQREAYGRLREEGVSSHQAHRFSWYRPTRVSSIEKDLQQAKALLASGRTDMLQLAAEEEGEDFDWVDTYEDVYDSIEEGLDDSPNDLEDILDYLDAAVSGLTL